MLSQIVAVTGVNIRSIRARLGSSSVAVVGIAGVVLVFVAVLSIAEGVNNTMKASGDPNTVLILNEFPSREAADAFANDPSLPATMSRAGVSGPPRIEFYEEA